MNRQELAACLTDSYGCAGERLFARYPNFQVFRHTGNKKWFAVLMDIPRKNLGLTGEGEISVVNLKCDTRLVCSYASYVICSIFAGALSDRWDKRHFLFAVLWLMGIGVCLLFRGDQHIRRLEE